jgi:leucyl-tRNA synthetase
MLKMGKTERNGVDPQDLIDRYGADTARLFVMFAAPPEQSLDWNNAGVEGANRFLKRLWKFAARHADTIDSAPGRQPARGGAPALRHEIHSVLRQVSYDYERMQYNTVVSGAMKLLNALETHAGEGASHRRRCARASASCCACSIRSARTPPGRSGTSSASPPTTAACSTRPGRRSTRARWRRTRSS